MENYEKKYKEALERAKKVHNEHRAQPFDIMLKVFPELKESEDERIRKEIIEHIIWSEDNQNCAKEEMIRWIAWLEKQGEQKSFDYENANIQHKDFAPKAKSKFKVGDYIISNNNSEIIYHITGTGINELGNPDYVCEHVGREKEYNGRIYNMRQDKVDANFRLWTIQDAKDGDVLIDKSHIGECVFIFKEARPSDIKTDVKNPLAIIGYCGINHIGFTSQLSGIGFGDTANCTYYPATKEQHDLLFQKMKEAGYVFDFENKQLKKIEQKPAWSEDDERMYNVVHDLAWKSYKTSRQLDIPTFGIINDWLKSLKDRCVPQSKPAWSEEDETGLTNTIIMLKEGASLHFNKKDITKAVNWLKSLRPQNKWKPSDEQMEALKGE